MFIEVKDICNELSEAINLPKTKKVSAMINEVTGKLYGWCIVELKEDGTITPTGENFIDIKDLLQKYFK